MVIESKPQAVIPPGKHQGIITTAHETTKIFNPSAGPEEVVEIIVQPQWKDPNGAQVLPVAMVYTPVLNGLSGLSALLERLGHHPSAGSVWEPESLVGVEISFVAFINPRGMVAIQKDSIGPV